MLHLKIKLGYSKYVSNLFKYFTLSYARIHNHPLRLEPADQTYYSAEVDPGTPQHLRWSSLQQLQTAKNR